MNHLLTSLQRIALQPGEVLAARVSAHLTREQADRMQSHFAAAGIPADRVLILHDSVQLSAIQPGPSTAQPPQRP